MKHRLLHLLLLPLLSLALLLIQSSGTANVRSVYAAPKADATTLPIVFVPGIAGSMLVDPQGSEYWPAAGSLSHDQLTL